MRIRTGLIALAAMLGMLAPAAMAQSSDLESRSQTVTSQAFDAIQTGDPGRALKLVEPILAEFETSFAGKRRIYCAESMDEAALYSVSPKSDGGMSREGTDGPAPSKTAPMVLVNSGWCLAQYVRAFALIDLKRMGDAQAAFERLIQFAPSRSRYLNELGFIFQNKRAWQTSIDYYTRAEAAADLKPDSRDKERCVALRGIGYDLIELGRYEDAEKVFNRCLAISPDDPKSLGELEYIRQQRRKTT